MEEIKNRENEGEGMERRLKGKAGIEWESMDNLRESSERARERGIKREQEREKGSKREQ